MVAHIINLPLYEQIGDATISSLHLRMNMIWLPVSEIRMYDQVVGATISFQQIKINENCRSGVPDTTYQCQYTCYEYVITTRSGSDPFIYPTHMITPLRIFRSPLGYLVVFSSFFAA